MTIAQTNRPVFSAAIALETQDTKDTKARIVLFNAMDAAGANKETLDAKGDLYPELVEGILTGWQGAKMAASFMKDKDGKRMIKGRVINPITGAWMQTTKSRKDWQMALGSKVTKARNAFLTWQEGEKDAAAPAKRALDQRIVETLAALHKAVTKDKDAEAPTLSCAHGELLAAFVRASDIVAKKK